jgi:lysophospholipase L1-like esterase
MSQKKYSMLALGDSYTIGESLPPQENFPYQTIQILRHNGFEFGEPEILAKTGWTTDELSMAIERARINSTYDFVTLLIGVNNQYRGRTAKEYTSEFEALLRKSIGYANNQPEKVFVLSIPDWGATPFAEGRDRSQIANEIDAFNETNKGISQKFKVNYVDITPGSREAKKNSALVASDGLHPSALEYKKWAEKLAAKIESKLKEVR